LQVCGIFNAAAARAERLSTRTSKAHRGDGSRGVLAMGSMLASPGPGVFGTWATIGDMANLSSEAMQY
jgi:hypothetical protein